MIKNLTQARILLVEDYEPNIFLMEIILKEHGCDYDIATNGLEAVKRATHHNYDIILMDIAMPAMNGYEATKKIREHEKLKQLSKSTIISMTAHAFLDDMEKCLNAGMDDYISKPMNMEEFKAKLEFYIQNNTARKAG